MPTLSIIIPAQNMGYWLPTAIESCLWQTHKDLEIIIINADSTDSTEEIGKYYANITPRITYHFQKNKGIGETRELGQQLATGDFITWLDADDFLSPTAVETMLNVALQDNVPLVCGNAVAFSSSTFTTRAYFPYDEGHSITFTNSPNYWTNNVMWRWIFSLPFLRKGKNGRPFMHTNYRLGLGAACFMFDILSTGAPFSQCIEEVYYFRQEHKYMPPTPEMLVDQKIAHYLTAKNILLEANEVKAFIAYLNTQYWSDLQMIIPHMNTQNILWFNRILDLSLEIFSDLDYSWFSEAFLAPEVSLNPAFIPFITAFLNQDKKTSTELLISLSSGKPTNTTPFIYRHGFLRSLQHEIKSLFYNRSRRTKAYIQQLEAIAKARIENLNKTKSY